jgi:hypothetical protein
VWRFVDNSDGVVMKKYVLRPKLWKDGAGVADLKFWLVIFHSGGDGKLLVFERREAVHINSTEIKSINPRGAFDVREFFEE